MGYKIKITKHNSNALTQFYRDHIDEYKKCDVTWEVRVDGYFFYPQLKVGQHSAQGACMHESIYKGLKKITYEELIAIVNPVKEQFAIW